MSTDYADTVVPMAAADLTSTERQREVQFEHWSNFAEFLTEIGHSLLISTYQAGKLVCVSANNESQLSLSFQNFDRPMGMAMSADGRTMAVAARNKIWQLLQTQDIAASLEPAGTYGNCFLTRSAHVTGEIQAHEMGWSDDGELWIVNTLFSCLCTTDASHHFVPRWRPSFITELAPEDRCHLNGLAMYQGKPQYVTAMAETNHAGGWRPHKAQTGCLIDVPSGEIVSQGFAMPHSPRVHAGHLWVLDSGRGALVSVDRANGKTNAVARFPGYARGLAMVGPYACVGLSKIRETSTFDGVPIAEQRARLKCGVGIVDLRTGELRAQLEFKTGVDEIFDIAFLPGAKPTSIHGPFAAEDGVKSVWIVPEQR